MSSESGGTPASATPKPRSSTGHHVLLPAFDASQTERILVPVATKENLVSWTFGRGTVIWRIWPAVLLHTIFAVAVVSVSLETKLFLGIPSVMLTVLGVVIGFVISYRASSGYDRYYQGRTAWSDIARSSRTFSRLAWIHIPLKLEPTPSPPNGVTTEVDVRVARRVMAEKRIALDFIKAYCIAVKHHLRGEKGIYYEDLYPLVKPLHEASFPSHLHHRPRNAEAAPKRPTIEIDTPVSSPRDLHPEAPPFAIPTVASPTSADPAHNATTSGAPASNSRGDPVIPPINAYGTFIPPPLHHHRSTSSFASSLSSAASNSERRPLLPSEVRRGSADGLLGSVAADLVPFETVWRAVGRVMGFKRGPPARRSQRSSCSPTPEIEDSDAEAGREDGEGGIQRRWRGDEPDGTPHRHHHGEALRSGLEDAGERLGLTHAKHRPRVAGGGDNLPLEIVQSLSVWLSVLDARGVVPGSALGGMYGCLSNMEDSLSTLERILTTPLPFVYSVHIRTVWIYLFFLPFQLVDQFGWYTILGVGIASFIYLGLIAAGEEIEQPFGYDENDLDLDFFCRAIVHADIVRLTRISCPNVYLGAHHADGRVRVGPATDYVDSVFGGGRHVHN